MHGLRTQKNGDKHMTPYVPTEDEINILALCAMFCGQPETYPVFKKWLSTTSPGLYAWIEFNRNLAGDLKSLVNDILHLD